MLSAGQIASLVLGGGLVSGLVGHFLQRGWEASRHKRLRKEQLQELLLRERIAANKELHNLLQELAFQTSITQFGPEVLRWPKDPRVSPKLAHAVGDPDADPELKRQLERAERTASVLKRLREHVNLNSFVLAKDVQLVFWECYTALHRWQIHLQLKFDKELFQECPGFTKHLERVLLDLYELPVKAMVDDLGIESFRVASNQEVDAAIKRGAAAVDALLKGTPRE